MERDLRRLLDELSAAIDRTREGHEDRAELERLLAAVEDRLRDGGARGERRHLVDALRDAEARFDGDHPVLGDAIRGAIEALSTAGI